MPEINQTQSGRAWEYALASELARLNEFAIERDQAFSNAREAFDSHDAEAQRSMQRAAEAAVAFLYEHDRRLGDAAGLHLQADRAGQHGDVRDIVLIDQKRRAIGISAKHRHRALKHSRLSGTIDFGSDWYGVPCSKLYWNRVLPTFDDLARRQGEQWRDLSNKVDGYYRPILDAFMSEIECQADPVRLVRYVIGRFDFYKAIKSNGEIIVQSFNLSGALRWGEQLPMPGRIIEFRRIEDRDAYAELTLDRGWAISFRLHNAERRIVPSLKFDIQLIGTPQEMGNYRAPYGEGKSLV